MPLASFFPLSPKGKMPGCRFSLWAQIINAYDELNDLNFMALIFSFDLWYKMFFFSAGHSKRFTLQIKYLYLFLNILLCLYWGGFLELSIPKINPSKIHEKSKKFI